MIRQRASVIMYVHACYADDAYHVGGQISKIDPSKCIHKPEAFGTLYMSAHPHRHPCQISQHVSIFFESNSHTFTIRVRYETMSSWQVQQARFNYLVKLGQARRLENTETFFLSEG